MWPWKKRKIEQDEDKSPHKSPQTHPNIPPMMGYVARPTPPKPEPDPEIEPDEDLALMGDVAYEPQEEPDEKEGGEDGTSRTASAVRAGMEPQSTPRPNSFDPSKVSPSTLISLQSIEIAKPCRADWSKMQGDDKSRFCQTCQKSVYNLSAMTTPEAQALLADKSGELCARIYRRADGTMITGDCPVGQATPRRPFWGALLAIVAAIGSGGLISGCGANATGAQTSPSASMQQSDTIEKMRAMPIIGALVNKFAPQPMVTGGAVAIAPNMVKTPCPAPTSAPTPTAAPAPTAEPSGEPEMGEAMVAPHALMGRIACPTPKPKPKPTAEPSGEPEMGDISSSAGA